MSNRIAVILTALAALLGIGFIPSTAASANPVQAASATTVTATTTTTKDSSDPDNKPAPATLSAAQQKELADAGFTETGTEVDYSSDHRRWVTNRTFTNNDGIKVTLDDNGLFHENFNVHARKWETVAVIPSGTFMLTDVVLAPKGGKDFWCGDNGKIWTVQDLVADAAQQRDNVLSGYTDTFVPELGSGDVLEVAHGGGAWCFTKASAA